MVNKNSIVLSKTDYLEYRDCKKNAWVKIHKPDIYSQFPLSEFDKLLMVSGGEVEKVARKLFPSGIPIKGRDGAAQALTLEYIQKKQSVLFQPIFKKDGFIAAVDVLEYNADANCFSLYEIKSTSSVKKDIHYHDAAFQVNLLRKFGIFVEKIYIIHLNKEYILSNSLNINMLFTIADVTEIVESLCEEVSLEMGFALKYLSQDELPNGYCQCIYKGRSAHCRTFTYLNPDVPKYGVHDISNIGSSPKKLTELIDSSIFRIEDIPAHIEFNKNPSNQIEVYKSGGKIIDKEAIAKEINNLQFPLYFIDYETYAPPIPRYNGFSPYLSIPFQYALYVLDSPEVEPRLLEFIHVASDDPSSYFVESLREHIGEDGNIIVWYKPFEAPRNNELAIRIPEMKVYLESFNNRIYDLRDIFKNQHYVDKGFLGKTSIKNVLPIMVPTLSYKELDIQGGASASENWNRLFTDNLSENEKEKIIQSLKIYCGLDAYAMYAIWRQLYKIISN